MEQELHQVVRDQQDQAQPVEAEGETGRAVKTVPKKINQEV